MRARTHACMLILQGMGEFRASLISSAGAYHPEPGWEGRIDGGAAGRWQTGRKELGNGRCVGSHKEICFAQSSRILCVRKRNMAQSSKMNPVRKDGVIDRAKWWRSSRSSDGTDNPGPLLSFSFQTSFTSSPFSCIRVSLCLADAHLFLLFFTRHFPFFFSSQPVFFIVGNPPRPTGPWLLMCVCVCLGVCVCVCLLFSVK